jgi:hypothetical protein
LSSRPARRSTPKLTSRPGRLRRYASAALASVMCDGSPTNNCVERAGGRRGGVQRARSPQVGRSASARASKSASRVEKRIEVAARRASSSSSEAGALASLVTRGSSGALAEASGRVPNWAELVVDRGNRHRRERTANGGARRRGCRGTPARGALPRSPANQRVRPADPLRNRRDRAVGTRMDCHTSALSLTALEGCVPSSSALLSGAELHVWKIRQLGADFGIKHGGAPTSPPLQ